MKLFRSEMQDQINTYNRLAKSAQLDIWSHTEEKDIKYYEAKHEEWTSKAAALTSNMKKISWTLDDRVKEDSKYLAFTEI